MIAKDFLLLLLHRCQSYASLSKLKFQTSFDEKAYLGAEFSFGFSNSEFIEDNSFHLKDKKKIYIYIGNLTLEVL